MAGRAAGVDLEALETAVKTAAVAAGARGPKSIDTLVEQARACLPKDSRAGKDARTAIAYFEHNKNRMRYAAFKTQGLFLGSGVSEAGCKTVIGQRLKQSGMEWTVRGANAVIALRCVAASGRTEDYWDQRAA